MIHYDATGIKPSEGFGPIPKGKYLLKIISVIEKHSRNGDPMVRVDFELYEGKYAGKKIKYHYVTFLPPESKGAGIALCFLKSINEPFEGNMTIETDRWIGKILWGYVDEKQDLNGNIWNVVKNTEAYDGLKSEQETEEEQIPF